MKRINIDGEKTRANIDKLYGRKNSLTPYCKEKGLAPTGLVQMCIDGFGTESLVNKYIEAGVPIVVSAEPVPSLRAKRKTKGQPGEQIAIEGIDKLYTTATADGVYMLAELLINTANYLLNGLNEIKRKGGKV